MEEALGAGAEEVVVVTSPDKPALKDYFTPSAVWRARLADKPAALAKMEQLDALASRVRFVEQAEQRGLGHAVLQAAGLFAQEREPVLILLGDALVSGAESCSAEMLRLSRERGGASVVGLERVARERVSRYGIAAVEAAPDEGRTYRLTGLVEKPAPAEAPSDLAVAGRSLLSPRIFGLLAEVPPGYGGEIQLTDAIQRLIGSVPVYGYRYPGRRHDIGDPAGYREALLRFEAVAAGGRGASEGTIC